MVLFYKHIKGELYDIILHITLFTMWKWATFLVLSYKNTTQNTGNSLFLFHLFLAYLVRFSIGQIM